MSSQKQVSNHQFHYLFLTNKPPLCYGTILKSNYCLSFLSAIPQQLHSNGTSLSFHSLTQQYLAQRNKRNENPFLLEGEAFSFSNKVQLKGFNQQFTSLDFSHSSEQHLRNFQMSETKNTSKSLPSFNKTQVQIPSLKIQFRSIRK